MWICTVHGSPGNCLLLEQVTCRWQPGSALLEVRETKRVGRKVWNCPLTRRKHVSLVFLAEHCISVFPRTTADLGQQSELWPFWFDLKIPLLQISPHSPLQLPDSMYLRLIPLVNMHRLRMPMTVFSFLIEVQLSYNAVLITAIQKNDSVINKYTFSYSFPLWFITGY